MWAILRASRGHLVRPRSRGYCISEIKTPRRLVLGIETSCDDTGAAVVDEDGNILGQALNSQTAIHVE